MLVGSGGGLLLFDLLYLRVSGVWVQGACESAFRSPKKFSNSGRKQMAWASDVVPRSSTNRFVLP